MRTVIVAVLCALVACPLSAGTKGKKIIEYGNDAQNTSVVRQRVREYEEKLPFDGLVMVVSARNGLTLGWHAFSTDKLDPADFQQAIDDLKATKFEKFTDNFIQVISSPSSTDWFDPNWSNVAYNVGLFARVAKQGGCKGIMFDPEMYTGRLWSYVTESGPRPGHTFEEYRAKARERGREFIQAINKEFPDVTLLCLFGPSQLYLEIGGNPVLMKEAPNVLLSAFYDGVCEAATPDTVLVDGHETAYSYRRQLQFIKARKTILEGTAKLSMNPRALKKHLRAGFGLFPDWRNDDLPFNLDDPSRNFHSPAGFRAVANYAMESSDRYVWVYSSLMHWLDGEPPKPYVDALRLAKEGPGPGEKNPVRIIPKIASATTLPGYDDAATFAEMRKTMTEIFDFPKSGWRFKTDDFDRGRKAEFYKADFDDSNWSDILIGKFWQDEGWDYNGTGWYRTRFTAPKIDAEKQVFLAFGAVDDIARVWLNGKYIGDHDVILGWSIPFALEITTQLKPGQGNVLAVQVLDNGGVAGVWKSVKLMVK